MQHRESEIGSQKSRETREEETQPTNTMTLVPVPSFVKLWGWKLKRKVSQSNFNFTAICLISRGKISTTSAAVEELCKKYEFFCWRDQRDDQAHWKTTKKLVKWTRVYQHFKGGRRGRWNALVGQIGIKDSFQVGYLKKFAMGNPRVVVWQDKRKRWIRRWQRTSARHG